MEFSDTRVLITGSNGFLGKKLQSHLLMKGIQVSCLGRKDWDMSEKGMNGCSGKRVFIKGDVLDLQGVQDAVNATEPDYIIHLAAQSNAGVSFADPAGTCQVNCSGTLHLLESARQSSCDPVILFPGSADEYGLVISSQELYETIQTSGRTVTPEPQKIPELPVSEDNPLRPVSPYGVSKVFGDYLMRSYHHSYGMKTVVLRSFNIEGEGRGDCFVSSAITRQVNAFREGLAHSLSLRNISVLRDFTHVYDALDGYSMLMSGGSPGEVYNLGSMRTTSVASYLLYSLESCGFHILSLSTMNQRVTCDDPIRTDMGEYAGIFFEMIVLDAALLSGSIRFVLEDKGIIITTDKGDVPVFFDQTKFRPADNPVILADIGKIRRLGYQPHHSVRSIVQDQMSGYLSGVS